MNRFSDIEISFKKLPPVYGFRGEKVVSIEKALEPILPQIDELSYYIKIAKENCRYPSEHGLTHDQSAAIYIYTMEWGETTLYRVLNQALRAENRQELKVWFPYLKLFDSALDLLPTVREVLWRGVPLDIGKNFKRDQILVWWSVNSCSSSVNVIKDFLSEREKSTLFLIEAINGKKVSGYTEYEKEEEIILRVGTRFRVKSDPLDQKHGSNVVHLIEIVENGGNDVSDAAAATTMPQLVQQEEHAWNKEESLTAMTITVKNQMLNMKIKPTVKRIIPNLPVNSTWASNGITVAGGNGKGANNNQLNWPVGLFVDDDDDQTILIADQFNHRIIQCKKSDNKGQVIVGGDGNGSRPDQLNRPTDVLIDKETNSLIIADTNNRRVLRWSLDTNRTKGEILIDNIKCWGLAMDQQRNLYVSDEEKHAVRRFELHRRDNIGTVIAGGNGKGNALNQLFEPRCIFVDQSQCLYVSDNENHRVMKWEKGATEGVVIAGGQGLGNALTQLYWPNGIFVDASGTLYVAELGNHRVTRWHQNAKQGTLVVAGNGRGAGANQFNCPHALSFDKHGNLYVVDYNNHRVQRFNLNS